MCSCTFFFFKQKTAYEMRISDWSSDVCSSDLAVIEAQAADVAARQLVADELVRGVADDVDLEPLVVDVQAIAHHLDDEVRPERVQLRQRVEDRKSVV